MNQLGFKRKLGVLLLAAGLVLPVMAQAEVLTYSWPTNAGPLDPRGYSPNQMYAQAMVYEPLVRYKADGSVEPWLATRWDISPDGRTYKFILRDGVRFSDGSVFDAAAAKANIEAVLANRKRHAWMELVETIDHAEAPDAHTLRLVLKHPYYPTLLELAQVRPLRFAAPNAQPGRPIGTGPWQLVESRRGEFDRFARNPYYWGPKPAYDEVLVKVIPDPSGRAIALETGQLDLIQGSEGEVSADTFVRLKQAGYHTAISAPLATRVIALNTNLAPTNELAVRQAINWAVDKDAIVKHVLYGLEPRADTLFSTNLPYTDVGLKPYGYSPEKASEALEQAGWILNPGEKIRYKNGQPLRLELCFYGANALQKSVAEVVQANLGSLGFDVVLKGEDEGALVGRQRDGRFGMIFAETWGAPYDPHSFVSSMRYAGHADYQAQQGLPMKAAIDQEIGEILASVEEGKRQALYKDVLTTLHEQAVYVPISYLTATSVSRDSVENVQFGSTLFDVPFEVMKPGGE
ncbi:nickel ABC transporter, nickel/metallophore periplasmic binding protein [Pseudomonas luteola]|uniref:nickel ABC transporter substrate-binding protein n=1 Tax=Pseudomonas luteola TaxID=47886 RepID=UPI003D9FD865